MEIVLNHKEKKMSKRKTPFIIITSLLASLLVLFILTACSPAEPGSKGTPTTVSQPNEPLNPVQSNSGGSVTIEARLLGHQNGTMVFEISMDTHSVDLDKYDLKQLAVLRDDKGSEYIPIDWTAAPGGHHRSGKLVFAHADKSAKTFELMIRNVAGVSERVLRWQVQPE